MRDSLQKRKIKVQFSCRTSWVKCTATDGANWATSCWPWVHITHSIPTPSFPESLFQSITAILRGFPCSSLCLMKSLCRWSWAVCHRQPAPLVIWVILLLPSSRDGRKSAPGWAGLKVAGPGTIWSAAGTLEDKTESHSSDKNLNSNNIYLF